MGASPSSVAAASNTYCLQNTAKNPPTKQESRRLSNRKKSLPQHSSSSVTTLPSVHYKTHRRIIDVADRPNDGTQIRKRVGGTLRRGAQAKKRRSGRRIEVTCQKYRQIYPRLKIRAHKPAEERHTRRIATRNGPKKKSQPQHHMPEVAHRPKSGTSRTTTAPASLENISANAERPRRN